MAFIILSFHPAVLPVYLFSIGVGSFLASWIYLIHSSNRRYEVSFRFLSEPSVIFASIVLLSLSYFVYSPMTGALANHGEILWLNYADAIVCIGFISVIPGRLILSFFLSHGLGILTEFVISVSISLILVTVISSVFYWASLDLFWLKLVFIFSILFLGTASLIRKKKFINVSSLLVENRLIFSGFSIGFIIAVFSVFLVSLSVMLTNEFMIPGDAWISLKPGVIMIESQDIFKYFSEVEYPILWGILMAGLSSIAGIPILNTNVLIFPLTILSLASFYILSKYLFQIQGKVLITCLVLFGFSGGLGWIASNFLPPNDFWELSYKTQDMYFHTAFWNNLMFTHKTLALSLTLLSFTTFYLGLELKHFKQKVFLICTSAAFLSFAFYFHMIEILIGIPVLVIIAILFRRKVSKATILIYLATVVGIFFLINLLLNGYYLWLIEQKVDTFYQMLTSPEQISSQARLAIPFGLDALGILPFLVFGKRLLRVERKYLLWIIAGSLSILYFLGPRIWIYSPEYSGTLYLANALPWYFIPMRFGVVGMLAILSLFLDVTCNRWSRIGLLWVTIGLIIGNLWWGARTIDFIYPVVAIFAAFTFITLLDKYFLVHKTRNKKLASILLCGFVGLICSSSYIYGLYQTTIVRGELSDLSSTTINAIKWVNTNVSNDVGIVVPDHFNDQMAFKSFTSKEVIPLSHFRSNITDNTDDQDYLSDNNMEYIFASQGDIPLMSEGITISPVFNVTESEQSGGIAELTPKGFEVSNVNPLTQGESSCDWMDAINAESSINETSISTSNSPKNIIDHNANTAWTDTIDNPTDIIIDLGSNKMLCSIVADWFKSRQFSYIFTVSISEDKNLYTEIFAGKSTSNYFNFEEYDLPNIPTRYVKVSIHGVLENAPALYKLSY